MQNTKIILIDYLSLRKSLLVYEYLELVIIMFMGVGDVITFEEGTHTEAISRDALNVHNYTTAWLRV